MNSRRAISLAELLAVLSACTVVLTMSAALLHRAMRTQSDSRPHFAIERSSLRLSDHFRRDVHQAVAARTSTDTVGSDAFLRLEWPNDQVVAYSYDDGTVLRTLLRREETVSREEFEFPVGCKLEIRQADAPLRLVLAITSQVSETPTGDGTLPQKLVSTPVSLEAEAVVSRDWRFVREPARQEVSP
jgi:hypothetical protein